MKRIALVIMLGFLTIGNSVFAASYSRSGEILNVEAVCSPETADSLQWKISNPTDASIFFYWNESSNFGPDAKHGNGVINGGETLNVRTGRSLDLGRTTLTVRWTNDLTASDGLYSDGETTVGENMGCLSQVAPLPNPTVGPTTQVKPTINISNKEYAVMDNPVTISDYLVKIIWLYEQLFAIVK